MLLVFFFPWWGNDVLDWWVFKFLLINSVFRNFWQFRSHQPRVCPAGQARERSVTFLGGRHSQQVYWLLLLLLVWKSVGIPGAEPRRGTNRYLWCCPGPECHHSWTAFTCSKSVAPTATGCIPVVLEMDWISVLGACAQSNNSLCHIHFNQVKKVTSNTAAKTVDNLLTIFFLPLELLKAFPLIPVCFTRKVTRRHLTADWLVIPAAGWRLKMSKITTELLLERAVPRSTRLRKIETLK